MIKESNHEVIKRCLDEGKVKLAITYASGLEGEKRQINLKYILNYSIESGRINDAAETVKMMGRTFEISELVQLSEVISNLECPDLLNQLRATDNLPNRRELHLIFFPLRQTDKPRVKNILRILEN